MFLNLQLNAGETEEKKPSWGRVIYRACVQSKWLMPKRQRPKMVEGKSPIRRGDDKTKGLFRDAGGIFFFMRAFHFVKAIELV